MTRVAIKRMYLREYTDSGQITCYVEWNTGERTEGSEHSGHMQALVLRGIRDGVQLETETW